MAHNNKNKSDNVAIKQEQKATQASTNKNKNWTQAN